MISFMNDYGEGAHPKILQALSQTNLENTVGYGADEYCNQARVRIQELVSDPDADVHFLVGGTQANMTAISSFLRPHEAVIAADTGHIAVHETGAIEATGHKILTVPTKDGKLTPEQVQAVLERHTDEHMVKPKLIFISDATETGTVYTKSELAGLSKLCKKQGLYLYLDGARLGTALTSAENDLNLRDLAEFTDAFYIGGTKNGALFGEALVITRDNLKPDFRYFIKQKGGMLAKGRLLGVQFMELMRDGLYFELASHANTMAQRLQSGIEDLGYPLMLRSPTNQIFPIFEDRMVETLSEKYLFERWEKKDGGRIAIRLVTSWATKAGAVDEILADLKKMSL